MHSYYYVYGVERTFLNILAFNINTTHFLMFYLLSVLIVTLPYLTSAKSPQRKAHYDWK